MDKKIFDILAKTPIKSMTKEQLEGIQELASLEVGGEELLSDLLFIEQNQSDFKSYKSYDVEGSLSKNEKKSPKLRNLVVAILAILLTIAVSYFTIFNNSTQEVDYQIAFLPDGSQLQLMENASYSIDHSTFLDTRVVNLQGNAFFDVVHDEDAPFIVNFGKTKLSVLGTSFFIFQDEEIVSVRDGKVKVEIGNSSKILVKGDAISYSNKEFSKITYKTGKVNLFSKEYKNTPLSEVLSDLATDINAEIEFNVNVENCVYNGIFDNATALEVLHEMKLLYNLEYQVSKSVLSIDNATCE